LLLLDYCVHVHSIGTSWRRRRRRRRRLSIHIVVIKARVLKNWGERLLRYPRGLRHNGIHHPYPCSLLIHGQSSWDILPYPASGIPVQQKLCGIDHSNYITRGSLIKNVVRV